MKLVTTVGCSICSAVKKIIMTEKYECAFMTPQDKEGSEIIKMCGARELPVLEYNGAYYTGINALKKIKSLKGE